MYLILFPFIVCLCGIHAEILVDDKSAEVYLSRFGHLETTPIPKSVESAQEAAKIKEERIKNAIKGFQKYAGLNVTGELDEETKSKMAAPRCGVSDTDTLKRSGMYKWTNNKLTWNIQRYTVALPKDDQRRAIHDAFAEWSKIVPLDFSEVGEGSIPDLTIKFEQFDHTDGYPFDGPGSVLAHAFYPKDGRCHFDESEPWFVNDRAKAKAGTYTDLLTVAVHELGHALGLSHSDDYTAIMAPFYKLNTDDQGDTLIKLSNDDIYKIQALYGPRVTVPGGTTKTYTTATPEPSTTPTTAPPVYPEQPPMPPVVPPRPKRPDTTPKGNPCDVTIDGVVNVNEQTALVIAGGLVYETTTGQLANPRALKEVFPGGPDTVTSALTDAAIQNPRYVVVLFKGRSFWLYDYDEGAKLFKPKPGYPKQLDSSIKFSPTYTFQWIGGNLVVANGDKFHTWDEAYNTKTLDETNTSVYFPGIPTTATAGFTWKRDLHFLDDKFVYRYSAGSRSVESKKPINEVFYC